MAKTDGVGDRKRPRGFTLCGLIILGYGVLSFTAGLGGLLQSGDTPRELGGMVLGLGFFVAFIGMVDSRKWSRILAMVSIAAMEVMGLYSLLLPGYSRLFSDPWRSVENTMLFATEIISIFIIPTICFYYLSRNKISQYFR